jgi:signal transduction histidine kinase
VTPLGLTSWFKRRMLALVVGSSLAASAAPPLAYHLEKRQELVSVARADAARVASQLTDAVEQRPRLWRYDANKLSERLAAEGLTHAPALVVRDGNNRAVPVAIKAHAPLPARLLWGRAEVLQGGQRAATVWVAIDARPLWMGTLAISALSAVISLLIGAVLYLLPVRAIALAERRIDALMGQLTLTLREEERGRIARDLHDGAGQALTAARLQLLALRRTSDPVAQAARIDAITLHLDEALDEVKRSTAALMPPALAELGLLGALGRHCEAFAQAAGLDVLCDAPPALPPLEAHVETACYRIVQEALTNTARHAGATRAWVTIRADAGSLSLDIGDDGRGLGPDAKEGTGLESIHERARLLGGSATVAVATPQGPGMRLRVVLPIRA